MSRIVRPWWKQKLERWDKVPDIPEKSKPVWPPPVIDDFQALMEAPPGVEPAESAESQAQHADALQESMSHAIEELPHHHRLIVELHLLEGHSLRSVADQLGVPASTAHYLKQKALADLRKKLWHHPLIRRRLGEI